MKLKENLTHLLILYKYLCFKCGDYLSVVEVHTIHGQFFRIFQEVHLCFSRRHSPDMTERSRQSD